MAGSTDRAGFTDRALDGEAHEEDAAMAAVVWFNDPSCDIDSVGGKGANLAKLTCAGFPVPNGFCVTTDAYREVLGSGGLADQMASLLGAISFDQIDGLEAKAAEIRALIAGSPMPAALQDEVVSAYERLGDRAWVAVRSSGTAEDLTDTSFAGLHDTYLDIRGSAEVLDAVKRCWASMWTARAVAYRQNNGFDHFRTRIAVVIQEMVISDVSGVMFTGNPLTAAVDELVINASWGLGEAVVSGIVTPDQYVVRYDDLSVKDKTTGTKKQLIRRSEQGGTVTEDVPADRQDVLTLSDDEVADLADLGRRVQGYYSAIPQDIEWAIADGDLYLLQSRPVTGVRFSWDGDLEPLNVAEDDTAIWTRAFADEGITGAITPLFYSTRGHNYHRGLSYSLDLLDIEIDVLKKYKTFKYYRGEIYYNTAVEKEISKRYIWPFARNSPLCWGGTRFIEPAAHEEILSTPFDWARWLKEAVRLQLHQTTSYAGCVKTMYRYVDDERWDPDKFDVVKLRRLSDRALQRFAYEYMDEEYKYFEDVWIAFFNCRDGINMLAHLVDKWYDGPNPSALADLLTGLPKKTTTTYENEELWALAESIRRSTVLRAAFDEHEGQDFLTALEASDEGQEWLTSYREFLRKRGHRGHADRDIYHSRRAEDPLVDYRAFTSLLSVGSSVHPDANASETNRRRDAVIEEVTSVIRKQPLGPLKVQAFKVVLDYVYTWLVLRDDERASVDRHTYNMKRIYLEVSRRLRDRGILENADDYLFLGQQELFECLGGGANLTLVHAKIAGRRHNFEGFHRKQTQPPEYLADGLPFDPLADEDDGDPSVLRGLAQSTGVIAGRARVVTDLNQIGTVQNGEILVCNSTDPGWTPVFLVVGGIVTETGGVLSHAACLSREYGLPAVQIANAMQRIPDGAMITVDGGTGKVSLQDELAAV